MDDDDSDSLVALSKAESMDSLCGVFDFEIPHRVIASVSGEKEILFSLYANSWTFTDYITPARGNIFAPGSPHSLLHQEKVMEHCQRDSGQVVFVCTFRLPPPYLIKIGVLIAPLLLYEMELLDLHSFGHNLFGL
jgi:hypothetical protein